MVGVAKSEDRPFDTFSAWTRVWDAADTLHIDAPLVLSLHAAIQREMHHYLSSILPRPERVRGLGFAPTTMLISALWTRDAAEGDKLQGLLTAFNELRNAIAHQPADQVKACYDRLLERHNDVNSLIDGRPAVLSVALDICSMLGGGPSVGLFGQIVEGLDKVMHKLASSRSTLED